jgi:hypothetical protein
MYIWQINHNNLNFWNPLLNFLHLLPYIVGWIDHWHINFNLKDLASHIHSPGPYLK